MNLEFAVWIANTLSLLITAIGKGAVYQPLNCFAQTGKTALGVTDIQNNPLSIEIGIFERKSMFDRKCMPSAAC